MDRKPPKPPLEKSLVRFVPDEDKQILPLPIRDADEFKGTLGHEVLGHFGINTFTLPKNEQS